MNIERYFSYKPVRASVMVRRIFFLVPLLISMLLSDCAHSPDDGLRQTGARVHHSVSTDNAIAQSYFDEGLTLVYAYNRDQAFAAFRHAADADPKLAMAYWGEALAQGPNINYQSSKVRLATGREALAKAASPGMHASKLERELIDALSERFDKRSADDERTRHYQEAMAHVAALYTNDSDVQTLAAESLLTRIGGNNLYSANHHPRPLTKKLLKQLNGVLRRDPNHIGANHFWLHAIDASGQPQGGLRSAHLLSSLSFEPAASHLTHMGSHIYMQFGDWDRVAEDNERAIAMDEKLAASLGIDPMQLDYYDHDLDFAVGAELMRGNIRKADALYTRFRGGNQMNVIEYVLFEQAWGRIRTFPEPAEAFSHLVWRYAQVLADIHLKQPAKMLSDHAAFLRELPLDAAGDTNDLGIIAAVERGSVAFALGKRHSGQRAFQHAFFLQKSQPQDELPGWRYPTARQLADAQVAGRL